MKKLVIILFGPPGAGKGTQAELLSDKLSLDYTETSKVIEDKVMNAEEGDFVIVNGEKYPLEKEKDHWKNGILCSPPFVVYLMKEKIKELFEDNKNLVLAGSPRTLYEAKEVVPLLKELYGVEGIRVAFIKISAEETIFRNSHRRICELMRHPILYDKETVNLTKCPLDGSKLIKREGLDDPETIKVRLKEYKERTLPLIDYFKEHGLKVEEINGEQSVSNVFKDILKAVE